MKNLVINILVQNNIIYLLCLLLFSTALTAQQIGPTIRNLDDVTLVYPRPWDREALVVLDFTINSDGSIDDIKVVGGFHESRFVEAATEAANQLQFNPATERGEAVDWPGFRLSARFVYRNLFHTMNFGANDLLREAENLISDNKAGDAESVLQEALADNTRLFFENAMFHLRLGEVYLATNRAAQAVHELKLAAQAYLPDEQRDFNAETAMTHSRVFVLNIQEFFVDDFTSTRLQTHHSENAPYIPVAAPLRSGAQRGQAQRATGVLTPKKNLSVLNNTLMESVWRRAYLANVSTGNVAAVIQAYDNLVAQNEDAVPEQLQNQIGQVRQLQEANQRLTSAQIIYNGENIHYPSHRILAAINVSGTIETLDFQCESRLIRLPFQAEVEWNMPESWGQCAIRFRGEDGATFNLVEFPE